jgi:hypothetical protein
VRDEKMLEKLTTHDIQDVSALFSLADKCARAIEGHVWHSPAVLAGKEKSKLNASTTPQGGGGKNNKKKKAGGNQSLAGAPTTIVGVVAAGGGRGGQRSDKCPCQPSNSDERGIKCPVHNSTRHTVLECREIKKLMKQFLEKMQQQLRQDDVPSRQQEGKQKVDKEKGEEMEFQDAKRVLKAIYGNSDSDSNDNEHRKALHVKFRGSWDIMSWCIVKTLHREIAATTLAPRAEPHHKWMETLIGFDASDCPKNMVGVGWLSLLVSPTIANIKLYHILIHRGAALNLISLTAFKKL